MKRRAAKKSAQRALVIGVSKYSPPISQLPAVANDVKEMAKALSSRSGAFSRDDVKVLTDRKAKKSEIVDGLKAALACARVNETVFVYLAGHGTVVDGDYYFLPFDFNADDVEGSCVPLKTIKALFDKSKSKRVFLWLDFCHSGGVLARSATDADRLASIRRTLQVKQGQGKIIVAACTSAQSSYESATLGHGLFTDALLRGLKGEAKSAQGEVTASSLYDFIDHQIVRPDQQPVFFGEMSGRIVLMHFSQRQTKATAKKSTATPVRKKKPARTVKGTWIMLGENFHLADRVRNQADGTITVELTPQSGEEESQIAALRPAQFSQHRQLPFAVNNDACDTQVQDVVTEHAGAKQSWSLTLKQVERQHNQMMEVSYNGISPDEIATRRAGRVLINDPPPTKSRRGFDNDAFIEHAISDPLGRQQSMSCVVQEVYQLLNGASSWKDKARLRAVYLLKMSQTVEHVVELKLGAVRNERVKVTFKGQRPSRYSNEEPATIQIEGVCVLS